MLALTLTYRLKLQVCLSMYNLLLPPGIKELMKEMFILNENMMLWLSLLHSFIHQRLNLGSAPVQILLASCRKFGIIPARSKAICLSVNHTTKIIHLHLHHDELRSSSDTATQLFVESFSYLGPKALGRCYS